MQLASLPGAQVEFVPNDKSKPVLVGAAALEVLDSDSGEEVCERPSARRTLDGTPPPRRPTSNRRGTLSGD